ncbi:MAG: alginate export family protein [Planctomycetes bacterium]|nr:alginate export family protein [Planctomycetota bacterium]
MIDLGDAMRLRFDAQLRWRGEFRGDSYAQPKVEQNTDFVLQRLRLTLDFDYNQYLGARVTVQDSRQWGDKLDGFAGPRLASDQPELMLYEGYAELRNPFDAPLVLKVGRMAVPNLGNQRLISNLDWSNVARSFDGAQITFTPKGWWMTAFASNLREASALPIPGDENDDSWLVGAYLSNRMLADHQFDAFLYWRRVGDRTLTALTTGPSGGRGARQDYTTGLRMQGEAGVLFYNGMFAYQFGGVGGDTIDAWAAALEAGAKLAFGDQWLKISSEFAWASGDKDATDSRIQTFDPLLPFAHYYNGHQDLFAWRNLHSLNLKLAYSPLKTLSLHSDLHFFWLQHRSDSWYGLGFTRTDTAGAANSRHVGSELDLYVKYQVLDGHLSFWGGYSHFFPGEFVRDTGPKTSDQSFAFLMGTVNF